MSVPTVKLAGGRQVKLGRIRPKARPQALRLSAYYRADLDAQPPPPSVDYSQKAMDAIGQMYGNDNAGDCVIAGKMHKAGIWTGNESGAAAVGTTQEALASYHAICGPGDNGCVITDVLDVMKAKGIPVGGVMHKIDGYVAVDWTNATLLKVAIEVFGSPTFGINIPQAWVDAAEGGLWDATNSPVVGGHDVCGVGYNATGVVVCTWGGLRTITWAALASRTWVEECYVELGPDWYGKANAAPNGIDAAALAADLQKLSGGVIPDPSPTPPGPIPPGPGPTPVPPPQPTPPTPAVFHLTFSRDVPAGSLVRLPTFRAARPIPAGAYGVVKDAAAPPDADTAVEEYPAGVWLG